MATCGEDLSVLVERAQAGDAAALDRLLVAISPRAMRICTRMLPYREDAEEACQDVLLTVARKLDTFEGRSSVTTWVHSIAANSARQTYRSLKRRFAEHPTDELPDAAADPRTTSVIAGSRVDLLEALETLEVEQPELVEALVMRDVGELDYAEIARQVDIPVGTVKSRVHRARQAVRPLLTITP